MSVSQHTHRRAWLSRAGWLPVSSRWVAGSASLAAALFGLAADLAPAAAGLTGVAALSAAAFATTLLRKDRSRSESPAAQWKSYSETLIQPIPSQLPPPNSTFRGRAAELATLHERHRRWRGTRAGRDRAGAPVMIFMHGMAGIGKSAVAQTFAHTLSGQYPDGQLYANLGVAGAPRPSAEVLRSFLPALGWDAERIPEATAERAQLFRTLARGKQMLIVLDAARDPAQLRDLMPSEPGCTVIVTSRRDMSPSFGAHSLQLGPMTSDDGIDLLAAVTGQTATLDLGAATEIADACGAHPMALRAAADITAHQQITLRRLADNLRVPHGLAQVLDSPSRDLRGRLSSEYRRLNPEHQRAFRLLSIVGSRTFVPWVLAPALEVTLPEAENLLAALGAAQLVLAAGRDEVTAIDRYELPPIAHQLATSLQEPGDDIDAARDRLDDAYLEAAARVIRELDHDFAAHRPLTAGRWLPYDALLPERIAGQGQAKAWVREEYANLQRAMRVACDTGDHELGTRVAAWLGGCAPRGVPTMAVLDGFTHALRSASHIGDAARVDVLLARGAYRTALEHYGHAFEDFAKALSLCHAGARTDPGGFLLRRALVERRCGEAFLRAGEMTAAANRFTRALTLAEQLPGNETLLALITTLRYLADPRSTPPRTSDEAPIDDELGYWSALARCDLAVQREDWDTAEQTLTAAATNYHSDLRRAATLNYWRSRLHLARHRRQSWGTLEARRAVRAAHSSLHDHSLLDDIAGQVRIHCLLVSGYLAAGRPDLATTHLQQAHRDRRRVDDWLATAGNPLDALLRRATAELRHHDGHEHEAAGELRQAALELAANGDLRAVAEIAALTGDNIDALLHGADPESSGDTSLRAFVDHEAPITAGQAATLRVEISAAHLRRYQGLITGDHLTMLVFAGNADVHPRGHTIDLAGLRDDVHLTFELRPRSRGPVSVQVQLHTLRDGLLLQEYDACLPPVAIAVQEVA